MEVTQLDRAAQLQRLALREGSASEPAREPAHGPQDRNEKDGGDGHHQRAPQIAPAAGGENKLARRALRFGTSSASSCGGQGPADDGDDR